MAAIAFSNRLPRLTAGPPTGWGSRRRRTGKGPCAAAYRVANAYALVPRPPRLSSRQRLEDLHGIVPAPEDERDLLAHVQPRPRAPEVAHQVDEGADVVGLQREEPLV